MTLRVPPAPFEQILTIDFETYYHQTDYSLSKTSTSEYVRDPRFQVIGVGVKRGDEPAQWFTEPAFRAFAATVDWSKTAVVASNAQFDLFILSEKFDIVPAFIFCTQQNQGFLLPYLVSGGNSVKKMAEYYKLPPKGDEVLRASGKRLEDFTPEELATYGEYCKHDCWLEWEILKRQLPQMPEVELWGIDLTVRMFTNPKFLIDQPLLAEAALEEEKRKADLLGRIGATKEQLMSNEKFAAALMTLGVDPPQKTSGTTGLATWAFAKSDPGMKELLDDPNDEVRWLAEARAGVKSTIMESRIKRFQKLGDGGAKAPVFLKYAAAHTKRWGGADKTNFQNLNKDGALRKSLVATPGYVVLTADLSQVEPRGTAWLAEDELLLRAFADPKADIYCDFGTRAFGRTITKADKAERSVSKAMVIGLGYQMGWAKFALQLLAGPFGADPITFTLEDVAKYGVDLEAFRAKYGGRCADLVSRLEPEALVVHCAVAKFFVDKYRSVNRKITDLWKFCDYLLEEMVLDEAEGTFGPQSNFIVGRHKIIRPGGAMLYYAGLTGSGEDGYRYMGGPVGKKVTYIYGGKLVENLVQGFCRDILLEQMVAAKAELGIEPVTTTHDELVYIEPEAKAEETLKSLFAIMATPPAWCAGMPLKATGGFGRSYYEAGLEK
jgi:hypothetical protein